MSHAHLNIILANSQPHEEKAAVKLSTIEGAVAEFTRKMQALEDAQDKLSRCTCQQDPGFQIDVRRNSGPLDAELTLKRFRRMQAEDTRGCL